MGFILYLPANPIPKAPKTSQECILLKIGGDSVSTAFPDGQAQANRVQLFP